MELCPKWLKYKGEAKVAIKTKEVVENTYDLGEVIFHHIVATKNEWR
jgi:hypothetical protein